MYQPGFMEKSFPSSLLWLIGMPSRADIAANKRLWDDVLEKKNMPVAKQKFWTSQESQILNHVTSIKV